MKSQPRYIGIIGHQIAHTLSPAIHNAAFKELHLPFVYGVLDVRPEFLAPLVASIRGSEFAGANVTIPHKQALLPLLDQVQEDAATVGAVNTIVNRGGKLIGYNTDTLGIKHTLDPFKEKLYGSSIVILGAGGGGRAAAFTLAKFFSPKNVRIQNRSADRAGKMAADLKKIFPATAFETLSTPAQVASAVKEATLIINTTSVGMTPNTEALPLPGTITFSNQQIIFDIVYTPVETALLRLAKRQGAQTINGVEMFLRQAASAFTLWTGMDFPIDLARGVVLRALSGQR